jgi:hypothetical protein
MRTRRTAKRTAGISFVVAVGVLVVAGVAGATTREPATAAQESGSSSNGGGTPTTGSGGSTGGGVAIGAPGMTCIRQDPDCNDSGIVVTPPPSTGDGAPISCGTPVPSGSGSDGTVTYTPCPGPAPKEPVPTVVTPTPGMADVTARQFDKATIGQDDRTLAIDFWSGVPPCEVLDHVDVAYGADSVIVTLFSGRDASADFVACPAIAELDRVVITLDEPLAGRTIVDGALQKDAGAAV